MMTPILRFARVLLLLALAAPLFGASAVVAAPSAPGAIFTVTNTNDSGAGSFRQAILQSNSTAGKDTIAFNIAGAGPHVIPLAAPLQTVTDPVIIDGTTETGASCVSWPPTLQIVLSGSAAGVSASGLVITAGDTIVKGLVIQRFGDHGVELQGSGGSQIDCNFIGTRSDGEPGGAFGNDIGVMINNSSNNIVSRSVLSGNGTYGLYAGGAGATGNQIRGSYVGTNKTGSVALPNSSEGILVSGAPNTRIGGDVTAHRNVISGNNGRGVAVGGGATGVKIEANTIGLNATGTAAIANGGRGVSILNSGAATIGGTTDAQRNVISGNSGGGILIQSSSGAQILRNYIGVNASASAKVANNSIGVYLLNASNATIGGFGNGNVISGNGSEGIGVQGPSASGNLIAANYIGTNASGANLGNGFFGIHLSDTSNNTVGGQTGGTGNFIAFNVADGIYVFGSATGNAIARNSIYSNGDLGIDLGDGGVTANDAGDGDGGPNGLQNYPVLTYAGSGGGLTLVKGTLNSKPNQTYRMEVFAGDSGACDASGYGEGRYFLGALAITTDGGGNASFSGFFDTALGVGRPVTATATDSGGNTSEFSQCRNVIAATLTKVALPLVLR